jgi:hypothetical protein
LIPFQQRVDAHSQHAVFFFAQEVFPFKAIHSDNVPGRIVHRIKVFLSHSTEDKEFVQMLAAELRS